MHDVFTQIGYALSPTYTGTGAGAQFDLFMANHIYVPIALSVCVLIVARHLWIRQRS